MTNEQIQIACAKLDGWTEEHPNLPSKPIHYRKDFPDRIRIVDDIRQLPSYVTSSNSIVPLIEKQNYTVKARIIRFLQPEIEWDNFGVSDRVVIQELEKFLFVIPLQLCEALLRAVDKWKV